MLTHTCSIYTQGAANDAMAGLVLTPPLRESGIACRVERAGFSLPYSYCHGSKFGVGSGVGGEAPRRALRPDLPTTARAA